MDYGFKVTDEVHELFVELEGLINLRECYVRNNKLMDDILPISKREVIIKNKFWGEVYKLYPELETSQRQYKYFPHRQEVRYVEPF